MKTIKIIVDRLKEMIDQSGIQYLEDHAYEIYQLFLNEKLVDDTDARILLICLLSADYKMLCQGGNDKAALSNRLQQSCGLRKKVSDRMADVFLTLFNEENVTVWSQNKLAGLKQFCRREWLFTWEALNVWPIQNVQVDSTGTATARVRIIDAAKVEEMNRDILKTNPVVSAEQLFEIYQQQLVEEIDLDFDDYCDADDYYPPVAEDYGVHFSDLIECFCEKHGMELIEYDYEGETSNFY